MKGFIMFKKIISAAILSVMAVNITVSAFEFPEPDWGALLKEKRDMVSKTEFEIYAEADPNTAPYYGARLEPRSGTYIGMIAEESVPFKPIGSYLTYIQDMWQNDIYYPANNMIKEDNVVTTIGWTISNLGTVDYNQIRRVLDTLSSYNKPMIIRFANEMNVSSIGDDPTLYVDTFRKVADMVHEYPNFATVWSPNDLGALNRPFHYYYPGDQYVDWIGISSYMKQYFQGSKDTSDKDAAYFMTGKYAWATNAIKPILKFMQDNGIQKPVMLSECGVATNNIFGEDMTEWATPRLRNLYWYLIMKYPQIKMINSFNTHRPSETERYDITNYPFASDIYREASQIGAYLHSSDDKAEFVFQPANNAGTLKANNGIVKLYTLAYIMGQPDLTVNYSIDDVWYHSSNQIPYVCNMSVANIADGKHTLTIYCGSASNKYIFYKRGDCIRFGEEPDAAMVSKSDVKVKINGTEIEFEQDPIIEDGSTLVPMRKIFETLGATVDWDGNNKTITSKRGETEIKMTIGYNQLTVNGKTIMLEVPAKLINDTTMVPVRAIAESFGSKVDWDGSTRTVIITE